MERGPSFFFNIFPGDLDDPWRAFPVTDVMELPEKGEISPPILEEKEAVGLSRIETVEKARCFPLSIQEMVGDHHQQYFAIVPCPYLLDIVPVFHWWISPPMGWGHPVCWDIRFFLYGAMAAQGPDQDS